ncbi:Uma2 family endonuclease [Streptomyces sp. LX-29]|uniref:Uma2 family endonuclease n=1 Tax=unclassified Streptomyces TaxID=2593676 RepID=UPI001184DB98|nr:MULTISPECIES: Uma2 family endonuclease [unclassified Streptomyces]TVL90136.1 hypothetical protein CD790_23660 [Streptomyces sp. SAJ15]WFB08971.1 Uma2 family endonuclease [Streptomyces sp. LX-29]
MGGLVMTAPLPDQTLEELMHTYEHLDLPEGQRAELIGGEIVISPTPTSQHNWIFGRLMRMLIKATPDEWMITNTETVVLPATGERFIPDLLVCEAAALTDNRKEWQLPADDVLLACEITSPSTARRDRTSKLWGYAHSQVPVYLLVDPHDGGGSTTVYANPDGKGRFRDEKTVPFGERVPLPEPFGFELDTSLFPK